jgi:Fe-S-cluster containining protein
VGQVCKTARLDDGARNLPHRKVTRMKKTRDGHGTHGQDRRAPAPGLLEATAGVELDARRAQRLRTAELLRRGRTPLTLIDVADHGAAVAEEAVRQAKEANPPPPSACKEGCDWCCHLPVGTCVPEVIRIVDYLRETLPVEQFEALRDRVARLDQKRRELKLAGRRDARLSCALLVNHRCAAYPVRPVLCRGFNSSDASHCERFVTAHDRTPLPLYAPQLRVTAFVLAGTNAGLAEAGLKGERIELTAALHIALETPAALERFLAGAPTFATARLD